MHLHPDTKTLDHSLGFAASPPAHLEVLRLALAAKHLGLKEATVRHLRHYSANRRSASGHEIPGNGFAPAFLTLGRAVYVDIPVFLSIWRSQQPLGGNHV